MKKNVVRILTAMLMLSVVFSSSVFAAEKQQSAWDSFVGLFSGSATAAEDTQIDGVTYRTHIQNEGWAQGWVSDGAMSGSEGKGLRLEGLEVKIDDTKLPADLGITYQTQIQNEGWAQGWVSDGAMSGSEGKGLRLEAVQIKLTGDSAGDYSVGYKTHIQNKGWETDWSYNGDTSGTVGEGLRLEAIEIEIFKNIPDLTAYEAALAAVKQADYTAASWTAYQAVVNANVVTTDNLVSEVAEATANITAAQANLVLVPKVTSVTAINASQIQIAFNSPVDATTVMNTTTKVINGSNIVITPNATATALGTLTGVLSADLKTLTISNTTAFKGAYTVVVPKDVVKTTTSLKFAAFSGLLNVSDTTAPSVVKTEAAAKVSTKTIAVYFDEPLYATGFIAYVNGEAAASAIDASNPNRINITTTTALVAGSTSTISLTNVRDLASNYTTPNPLLTTVTVVTDATAPSVTSAVITNETKITVTYDKDVLDTSFASKARFNYDGGTSQALTAAYAKDANNVDIKNQIVLSGVTLATSSVSGNLVIDAGIKDLVGNAAVAYTNRFTFTKDTVAPTLTSASFTDGKITGTFSKNIVSVPAKTVYAINTATGVSTPITLVYSGGSTNAVITNNVLVITQALADGTYQLQVPAGTVVDTATTPNGNTLGTQTFTVSNSATSDTTPPTIASLTGPSAIVGAVTVPEQLVTYTAADAVGLDVTTILNITNYTFNGLPLPSGSYVTNVITYDSTGTKAVSVAATVHVPSTGITVTKTAPFTVNGVRDLAGNYIAAVATTNATFYDGVAPVITAAKINTTTGTIVITPSEALTSLDEDNFVIKAGTTTIAGTVTAGTGTDEGKLLFTPTTATEITTATDAITVTTVTSGTPTTDLQGNVLTFGTIITAV